MIAEFNLEKKKVVLNFEYNPVYPGSHKTCDYCSNPPSENVPTFQAGHSRLMDGWATIDGDMISKVVSFEQAGAPTFLADDSGPEHQLVVEAFLSRLVDKTVHLVEPCLSAWMDDANAHPEMSIRFEQYIQDQIARRANT